MNPNSRSSAWRTWLTLNANELAWSALVIVGVLFTALFVSR
jgi:hypothetical protein